MTTVYIVLMITNLGLGPKIETTGIVGVFSNYDRAVEEQKRVAKYIQVEGARFVIKEEKVQ